MTGCSECIADNALDACGSSRCCDRRCAALNRCIHADPPPGLQRFSPASDPDRCQLVSRRLPEVPPRSRHPDGWREREGSSPRVTPLCGPSTRSLSSGSNHGWRHVVDCAASIARSGPTPRSPLICKGSGRIAGGASHEFGIDCLRSATTSRRYRDGGLSCAVWGWGIGLALARRNTSQPRSAPRSTKVYRS